MKEGWEYKKLSDVCEILNGFAFKSSRYVSEGIRIIRISNVQKGRVEDNDPKFYPLSSKCEIERYLLREGDLLISLTGNVGRVGRLPQELLPAALNQRVACLRLKGKEINKQYLYHFLNSDYFVIKCTKNSSGVAQLNLSTAWLSNYKIAIPPFSEQQSIVDYLDSAFAKIDAMKANAEKALGEAKALFQASLKEMLEPKEGWEEKKLGDIVSFFSGYAFESKRYTNNNDDILLICGDNIVHCDFRWETIKHWPKEEYDDLKRFSLEKNDIVLAMDRPWVKSGLKIAKITPKELPSLLIQRTACIRAPKDISSDFVFYALQTEKFIKHLVSQQNGVGVPHISGKQILSYKISIPKYVEQQSIVETLDSLKSKVDCLQANYAQISQECDALKQAILRQVFE